MFVYSRGNYTVTEAQLQKKSGYSPDLDDYILFLFRLSGDFLFIKNLQLV